MTDYTHADGRKARLTHHGAEHAALTGRDGHIVHTVWTGPDAADVKAKLAADGWTADEDVDAVVAWREACPCTRSGRHVMGAPGEPCDACGAFSPPVTPDAAADGSYKLNDVLTASEFAAWAFEEVESEAEMTADNNERCTLADYAADLATRMQRVIADEFGDRGSRVPEVGQEVLLTDGARFRVASVIDAEQVLIRSDSTGVVLTYPARELGVIPA